MNSAQSTIMLGDFKWCSGSRKLERKTLDSQKVEAITLTPKQLRLLICLYEAYPDVASREHIVDYVWESKPISVESLPQLISRTRVALDDYAKRILVNEPGVGYSLAFTQLDAAEPSEFMQGPADEIVAPPIGTKQQPGPLCYFLALVIMTITAFNIFEASQAVYYASIVMQELNHPVQTANSSSVDGVTQKESVEQ
uniref:winged helix-turn-helix domain-containing protein n=1 Tax=Thaumasiovibrio occultus TaxID=1891184 RepID=UPI000B357281|nr:winged helix-turn-helix domain-containing protein [Thaumasiovibrio occultus]